MEIFTNAMFLLCCIVDVPGGGVKRRGTTKEGIYEYLNKRAERETQESLAKIELEKEKLVLEKMRLELEKKKICLYERSMDQQLPEGAACNVQKLLKFN